MKWDHDTLAGDLARHLKAPDRLVWMDMQIGPMHSPRPDVFTLQKSYSRPSPTAYECKISVSDFRRDLTSGKWQDYHAFAGAVTFCVPHGLCKRDDIPAGCGFMVRGETEWATIRKPTRQLSQLTADHLMKLLIDGYGQELGQVELRRRDMRAALASDKIAKKFGRDVAEVIRDLDRAKRMVEYYEGQGRERVNHANESVASMRAAQEAKWAELAAVLGLPEGAHRWDIDRAITALSKPDQSDKVTLLKRSLSEIENIARRVANA